MKQENKYYVPDLTEFHIGFECEIYDEDDKTWDLVYVDTQPALCNITGLDLQIRVKYLDREDIESLGFTNKNHKEIPSKFCYYKFINDNTIYKIQVYWQMLTDTRENLIRIYKGKPHQYPYEEIFRGDIKNKSELKKLLKQLNII